MIQASKFSDTKLRIKMISEADLLKMYKNTKLYKYKKILQENRSLQKVFMETK